MFVVNFSHSLTDAQQQSIGEMLGYGAGDWWERLNVRQVRFHANIHEPFAPQVPAVVDRVGLSPEQWRNSEIVVVLPSISTLAALVLVELKKRCGYFPSVVRIKKASPITEPATYVVAEIIELE